GEQPVEQPVIKLRDLPEGVRPLEEAAAERLGDFLRQQQEFPFVGVEGSGQPADQRPSGEVSEVEFAILDLADVGVGDAHLSTERTLAQTLARAQFPYSGPEPHRPYSGDLMNRCLT